MDIAKVSSVHFGTLKLDGGAMFSIIPKKLWSKYAQADEQNLCTWNMNSLVIEEGKRKILIDTGIGNKYNDRFRAHFTPLPNSWEDQSMINAEEITDVILTHLHFDHVGGALLMVDNKIVPAFPNAIYWTNKVHYDWAVKSNDRERASFIDLNYVPLLKAGKLKFVDVEDDLKFSDAISLRYFYGHTKSMMLPIINTGSETILFCSDLIPSHGHIGIPYITSYDIQPLLSVEEKERTIKEALDKNWTLFLQHDPTYQYARLQLDDKGRAVAKDLF